MDIVRCADKFSDSGSVLVAALGVASTEPLKTGVSSIGTVISILSLICALHSLPDTHVPVQDRSLIYLPALFAAFCAISTFAHARKWYLVSRKHPTG